MFCRKAVFKTVYATDPRINVSVIVSFILFYCIVKSLCGFPCTPVKLNFTKLTGVRLMFWPYKKLPADVIAHHMHGHNFHYESRRYIDQWDRWNTDRCSSYSVTVLDDFSLLNASWYLRLSTSFFSCGTSISSMAVVSVQSHKTWKV